MAWSARLLRFVAVLSMFLVAGPAGAAEPQAEQEAAGWLAAPLPREATILPADDAAALDWAAWVEGRQPDSAVRLALLDRRATPASAVWSKSWPGAYTPRFQQVEGWVHAGRPVFALTKNYGAAAQEVTLFALDAVGRPVQLAEMLEAAVDWVTVLGRTTLVAYRRPSSALVPTCFGWDRRRSRLVPVSCRDIWNEQDRRPPTAR